MKALRLFLGLFLGTTDAADPETGTPATDAAETPASPQEGRDKEWLSKIDAIFAGDEPAESETDPAAEATSEDTPPASAPPAGASADEGADAGAGEGDAGPGTDDGALVLRLPGRRASDKPTEVALDAALLTAAGVTPEQARERIAQLNNGFMRGEEIRAAKAEIAATREEIAADREELASIETALRTKPVDFLLERVSPQVYRELAEAIVLRMGDEEFDALLDRTSKWERDPGARKVERAEAREREITAREAARTERENRAQSSGYATEISTAIVGLVPETMDDAQADEFFDFALHKLERWAGANPGTRLAGADVPKLLAKLGALTPFGIGNAPAPKPPTGGQRTPSDTRRATGPVTPEARAKATQTAKDLAKRTERRREAAAVTPAGTGSGSAADAAPPKGQTFDSRMSWLEKKLGLK